jgi:hypothetical protein
MTSRERNDAAEMVAMFVGDENAREIVRASAQTSEAPERLALAEAAIDHQASGAALDQQRVARAAAAKRREANHCNCL